MVNARRAVYDHFGDRLGSLRVHRPGMIAQVRLFGLLVLLVTLFAGLQEIVAEGVPRVEVRLGAARRAGGRSGAGRVPVERVVERIVYVPVERPEAVAAAEPSATDSEEQIAATAGGEVTDIVAPDADSVASAPEASERSLPSLRARMPRRSRWPR